MLSKIRAKFKAYREAKCKAGHHKWDKGLRETQIDFRSKGFNLIRTGRIVVCCKHCPAFYIRPANRPF